MAAVAVAKARKWSETAMLVIDMQVINYLDSIYNQSSLIPNSQITINTFDPQIRMKKEFILPGRRLHVPGSSSIVPSVITAVSTARDRGIPVIWVVREHDPYGRDVEFFRRHLYEDGNGPIRKGSDGVDLVDGLSVEDGEYRLVKTRFSAFFETHLNTVLHSIGIKNLVIVGVQTPNCIRQTVFDAVSLDYQQITVITDATAAATLEIHNANILDMKNVGVVAVELQDWIDLQN